MKKLLALVLVSGSLVMFAENLPIRANKNGFPEQFWISSPVRTGVSCVKNSSGADVIRIDASDAVKTILCTRRVKIEQGDVMEIKIKAKGKGAISYGFYIYDSNQPNRQIGAVYQRYQLLTQDSAEYVCAGIVQGNPKEKTEKDRPGTGIFFLQGKPGSKLELEKIDYEIRKIPVDSIPAKGEPSAAQSPAKKNSQFDSWRLASGESNQFAFRGCDLSISPLKWTAMVCANRSFPLSAFSKVTFRAKFKGRVAMQMIFHVYDSNGKYLATFPSEQIRRYTPDTFSDFEYTYYVPAESGIYKGMKKALPCLYFYRGTSGELSGFQWKKEKFSPDRNSPLSDEPAAEKSLPMQRQLVMADDLYAVPGVETNVYFDNVFLPGALQNFKFEVSCKKGSATEKKWSYTPADQDCGTYDWILTVSGPDGVVARKTAKLHVAPRDAGKGKKISLLMIGDSIIGSTSFPKRVHALFQSPDNPAFTMIGTRPRMPSKGGMAHEGFPGWRWYSFLAGGPFVVQKEGFPAAFDVQRYFDKANGGKAPDFITIQLGVNDIFAASDFLLPTTLAGIGRFMDEFLAGLRKAAPNAVIGIGLPTPGSKHKDLKPMRKAQIQRYRRNFFALNYFMLQKFANRQKDGIFLIPVGTVLDTENNFPVNDHVHPSERGGNQLGDALYAWLKWQFYKQK